MKGYNLCSRIQQTKEAGFSQRTIARSLRISRKTVKRYLDMPLEQYNSQRNRIQRQSALDEYRDTILRRSRKGGKQTIPPPKKQGRLKISPHHVINYLFQLI